MKIECNAAGSARVRADERRKLRQVLINLLGNAVKFTGQGSVRLRMSIGKGEEAPASSTPMRVCRFEVCDTGDGIPVEAQQRIFEPFQRGSAGQRWAGRAWSWPLRRMVELMGGRLELESSPGAGSRFFFSLSLALAGGESAGAGRREVLALAAGYAVLAMVVDDIPENREVLARRCSCMSGARWLLRQAGPKPLQLLEQQTPDIVFLDALMPGMDGMETARQIRHRLGASVRLVATSASAFAHEQDGYLAAGFEDVVFKPIPCDRLYDCLTAVLGVKFDYAASIEPDGSEPGPVSDESLPVALRARLAGAAELYSVTELRQCIEEIERLGPPSHRLGLFLRRCVHDYDMGGILRLVEEASGNRAVQEASKKPPVLMKG